MIKEGYCMPPITPKLGVARNYLGVIQTPIGMWGRKGRVGDLVGVWAL